MKKVLTLGLTIAACAVAAYAYPTLAGPTGYGVLPTADVVGAGVLNIAADYYDSDDSTVPIRVVYGIADNFELGASYRSGDQNVFSATEFDGPDSYTESIRISDMWGINGKWATGLTPLGFDWSLGAQYLQGDLNAFSSLTLEGDTFSEELDFGDYSATQLYFVGTRNFTDMFACPPDTIVRGTIGVNWTKIDADVDDLFEEEIGEISFDEDAFRFFLGLDATFSNKFMLAAEYQTKDSDIEDDALYGITARYAFNEALAGQLGYTNEIGGVLGGPDGNFFVGLNYGFCTTAY